MTKLFGLIAVVIMMLPLNLRLPMLECSRGQHLYALSSVGLGQYRLQQVLGALAGAP
jgi:hypothetical protein